jgi:hypothetical protein
MGSGIVRLSGRTLRKRTDVALPTIRLGRRVRRLEESVRENALLAEPLERQVAGLEQHLARLLDAGARRRRG